MTNPRLKKLLREAVVENRNEKICLIEDVMKAKKLLFAWNYFEHTDVITTPVKVFDNLYELDIQSLELIKRTYERKITAHATQTLK